MQKRYLMITLNEAYELYKNHTSIGSKIVGRTTFCELKPPHVKLMAEMPHNVCVCQQHSNFAYLCSALKIVDGFPQSYQELLEEMCCNVFEQNCMTNMCKECQKDVMDILPIIINSSIYISWKKWEKNKSDNRVKNNLVRGTYNNIIIIWKLIYHFAFTI